MRVYECDIKFRKRLFLNEEYKRDNIDRRIGIGLWASYCIKNMGLNWENE